MTRYHARLLRRVIAVLAAVAATTVSSLVFAAPPLKIGWTTSDSPNDPYAIAAHYFAEELQKSTPGKYEVKFYPNHQLGNDEEMLQGLQFGTLDAGVITGTLIGTVVPAFQLNDLPFLYANEEQAHTVLDGKVGDMLFAQLAKKGAVGLGFAEAGFRNVINNVRPINTPDDLKGIKLRVQPSDMFLDSFRALGANPVPMPWSDTFTAVQQGTVDGLEIPLAVIYANKYPEVTKYLSLTNHSYNALALLISSKVWNKLDAKEQGAMRSAARAAIERQRATVEANNGKILADIEKAGMKVNKVSDQPAFRAKVSTVYSKYRNSIGGDILDDTLKQLK